MSARNLAAGLLLVAAATFASGVPFASGATWAASHHRCPAAEKDPHCGERHSGQRPSSQYQNTRPPGGIFSGIG
jgi:hypothetical protein